MEREEFKSVFRYYGDLSAMLKAHGYEEILQAAAELIGLAPEELEQQPMGGYSKGMTSGAYRFTLQDLLKNIRHYDWLYERLEDETSRLVFANLVAYRVLPLQSFLKAAYDGEHPQYFDKDIVSCGEDEVFVDCGGYTGDTTEEFIRQFGKYRKIYVYEPNADNARACRANLSKYRRVAIRPCGVGERSGALAMGSDGSSSTFMVEQGTAGSPEISIVSLDEDIQRPVTFLKMDVEGFEIPALLGAKRHIRDDFPKLAICTYHIVSDMWEIPRLIDAIHPGYRFYIRHYNFPQNWETVIYAIPPEEAAEPARQSGQRRVVSLAFDEGWWNGQLLKDCGLIPFLLHKNHGCDSVMVGGCTGEYPNLRYVEGLRLEFLQDNKKAEYLLKEARNIDCLLLYGPYPAYFSLADIYKRCNPQGKIALALDANAFWMDRIQWAEPEFRRFMEQCDVITASGRTMQRYLNEKWPWPIEYIPNGFYNFSSKPWNVDFDKKENIILTVGRLGIPQKATDVLLDAFAKIAPQIPDWELHLAGGVDPAFQPWLNGFWRRFPELRDRIRFLGNIADRDTLYKAYQRARIFALPSQFEGGTPNVIGEALFSGNAIAVTRIDEYPDAIDHGRCGLASEDWDADSFSEVLLQLCQSQELDTLCRNAYDYAQRAYNMEKAVARLYALIFDGEESEWRV